MNLKARSALLATLTILLLSFAISSSIMLLAYSAAEPTPVEVAAAAEAAVEAAVEAAAEEVKAPEVPPMRIRIEDSVPVHVTMN